MGQQTDKEYLILSRIDEDEQMSQRELARSTGLSLGTVNLLLKKMVREGLVKMDSIPANRVVYMLTPQGMVEKARKTVRYVRHHYAAIDEMLRKIQGSLDRMVTQWGSLYVLVGPDEIGEVVRRAVAEWDGDPETLAVISCPEEALDEQRPVVVCVEPGEEDAVPAGFSDQRTVIRLLERL